MGKINAFGFSVFLSVVRRSQRTQKNYLNSTLLECSSLTYIYVSIKKIKQKRKWKSAKLHQVHEDLHYNKWLALQSTTAHANKKVSVGQVAVFFYKTLWKIYGLNFLLISSQLMTSLYKSTFCYSSAECTHSLLSALKLSPCCSRSLLFWRTGSFEVGDVSVEVHCKSQFFGLWFFSLETVSCMRGLSIGVRHSRDPDPVGWGTLFPAWMVQGDPTLSVKVFLSSGEPVPCLFSCISCYVLDKCKNEHSVFCVVQFLMLCETCNKMGKQGEKITYKYLLT